MLDYFVPHQESRQAVQNRIDALNGQIEQLNKELDRRKSPTDEFKYGIPITFRNEQGQLQDGWKIFDTSSEAFDNAGKYFPELVHGNDDVAARYKVEKVYV